MLIAICHDEEQPNGVLVELAKLVGQESRKAVAAAAPADQVTFAVRKDSPLQEMHNRFIDALAARKALSIPQLMYLGDACAQLDRNDAAREIYQRILASVDQDESAKAAAGAAITGIRARLVRLLRSEGKLNEAASQATALIKEHPNALEPLMEKGYILQSLAESDPRRYDECLAHWTDLRVRLQRSKNRPPEYYDVIYNAALCLMRQARLSNSQPKALQAEQILKSTLTLSPKLNGPETVAKYEALLKQIEPLRGAQTQTERAAGTR
jgi:tetratricopeptide (TPR) repeat protein